MLRLDSGKYYSGGKIGVAVDLGTTTIHYAFVKLPIGYKGIPLKAGKKKKKILPEKSTEEECYPDSIRKRIAEGLKEYLETEKRQGSILEVTSSIKGEEFFSDMREIFEELTILKVSSSINPQVAFGGYCFQNF